MWASLEENIAKMYISLHVSFLNLCDADFDKIYLCSEACFSILDSGFEQLKIKEALHIEPGTTLTQQTT